MQKFTQSQENEEFFDEMSIFRTKSDSISAKYTTPQANLLTEERQVSIFTHRAKMEKN